MIVSHDRGLLNRAYRKSSTSKTAGSRSIRAVTTDRSLETDAVEQNARARQRAGRAACAYTEIRRPFSIQSDQGEAGPIAIKMLERMEPILEFSDGPPVTFNFPDPDPPLAPPLFSVLNAAVGYDGTPVLKNLSLRLDEDDRIALIVPTERQIDAHPAAGRAFADNLRHVMAAPKLRVGYFAQHQTDELDVDATPVIELGRKRPDDRDEQLRSQLGRFGFSQQRADTTANLSGGEKARLFLL